MDITFTIPDEKLPRIVNAFKTENPIPVDEEGSPLFTDTQWARMSLIRLVVDTVERVEKRQAKISVVRDETLIS